MKKKVVIIGGGPAGLALAIKLARSKHFEIEVFELREDNRVEISSREKLAPGSYAIGIWQINTKFLESIGASIPPECGVYIKRLGFIMEKPRDAIPAFFEELKKKDGVTVKVIPSRNSVEIKWRDAKDSHFMTTRDGIRMSFLDTIDADPVLKEFVKVHFNSKMVGFKDGNPETNVVLIQEAGSETIPVSYDYLIAADGVHSRVRQTLDEFLNSKSLLPITKAITPSTVPLRVFTVPVQSLEGISDIVTGESCTSLLGANRKKVMMFFPVGSRPKGTIKYISVVVAGIEPQPQASESLKSWNDFETLVKEVETEFPSVDPRILFEEKTQFPDFVKSPVIPNGHYVQVNRYHHENIAFIGDAAHAMYPNLGCGVNTSLEDSKALGDLLIDAACKGEAVDFSEFSKCRQEDCESIQNMSAEVMITANPYNFLWNAFLFAFESKILHFFAPSVFSTRSLTYQLAVGEKTGKQVKRGRDWTKRIVKTTGALFALGAVAGIFSMLKRQRKN